MYNLLLEMHGQNQHYQLLQQQNHREEGPFNFVQPNQTGNNKQIYILTNSNSMETVFREIAKQTNKISRILTKIIEKYPQTSSEIELALFATIKIEKTVNKHLQSHSSSMYQENKQSQNKRNMEGRYNSDPILDAAFNNIQSFKQSTNKLQSKINILINQTENKGRRVHTRQQVDTQPQPIMKKQNLKPKFKQSRQRAENNSQLDVSKSLVDIQKSIQRISAEIIQKIKPKGRTPNAEEDEQ